MISIDCVIHIHNTNRVHNTIRGSVRVAKSLCFATVQLDADSPSIDSAADFADDPTRLTVALLASRTVGQGRVRRSSRLDDLTYKVSRGFVLETLCRADVAEVAV